MKPARSKRATSRPGSPGSTAAPDGGAGAKGPRRFEWARGPIPHPYDPQRWQRWRLVCRACDDPEGLAFYLAFGPAGTSLEVLARGAGRRSRH
jgi:hypothetical protein